VAAPTGNIADQYAPDTGVQIFNLAIPSFSQYSPGANSDGSGGTIGQFWGIEASFSQTYRSVVGNPLNWYKQCPSGVGLMQQTTGDDWSPLSSGKQWDKLTTGFSQAVTALGAGVQVVVPVVIWMGGETDTTSLTAAMRYGANLVLIEQSLRDRLGIQHFLFIVNRVRYEPPNGPWTGIVRSETEKFVASDPANRAMLDSDSIPFGVTSSGHYEPSGGVVLGRRAFQLAYDRLWR
jgi:hypothetical protein